LALRRLSAWGSRSRGVLGRVPMKKKKKKKREPWVVVRDTTGEGNRIYHRF
jgi:hypothetical protein